VAIRRLSYEPDYDVLPQAIFWRPLKYFTMIIRDGEDGLDLYKAASFAIGNEIKFDLRVYRGHPELTVTLYLPDEVTDEARISEIIDLVIRELVLPPPAVAWRRGQTFDMTKQLERRPDDRLHEPEARGLALKIAAQQPGRAASTQFLKKEFPKYIELSAADRAQSKSRANEAVWTQVVGNVISHQKTQEGPFAKGYARRTADGLSVTQRGINYLNSMGFISSPARSSAKEE
jgi:hypothetical protein